MLMTQNQGIIAWWLRDPYLEELTHDLHQGKVYMTRITLVQVGKYLSTYLGIKPESCTYIKTPYN